jgi:hypothetical protein
VRALALAVALLASPAYAGNVALQLNDVGVAGLESALELARKHGSMHDADMAVSIYNALQAAKIQAMQDDAARLKELDSLKRQLETLKAKPPEKAP